MSNRVRDLRVAHLWKTKTLARKARLDPSTISRIESGGRTGNLLTQERIARALGVPREEVFPPEEDQEAAS